MKESTWGNAPMENKEQERSGEKNEADVKSQELFHFEEKEFSGSWLVLENDDGVRLEGKLLQPEPEKDNGKIVIFHPGIPGDGVTWFEEKQAPDLLREGYTIFSSRHAGLIVNRANEKYVHSDQRLDANLSADDQATHATSLQDWLREPELTISFFGKSYKNIVLITHSFSALSGVLSLARFADRAKSTGEEGPESKVEKWILLSGIVSKEEAIPPEKAKEALSAMQDSLYALTDVDASTDQLREALDELELKRKSLPKHIPLISIYPEGDSFVSLESGKTLQKDVGRGLLIDDKSFLASNVPHGSDAHEYPHMKEGFLTRLVKAKVPAWSKHTATVKKPV